MASVFSSGQWWTAIAVAAALFIGTAFLRVIVNPTVKQIRQLRNSDAEARVGTVAALNITVERALRSYELQLVIGGRHVWGTYPLGARGVDDLVDTLGVLQSTQD